jgi:signal transduction histidine kinase
MLSWLRSHSLRISLTFWNVAAMIVVLAVYATGVYIFVSRNASNSLDTEIRYDYQWAAAMADQLPDGSLRWFEEESSFGSNTPWLQVWCSDDTGCGASSNRGDIVFRTTKAEVDPLPEAERLLTEAGDGIVSVPTPDTIYRVLTAPTTLRFYDRSGQPVSNKRVIIQVARSELLMRDEMEGLLFILLLGLPIGVVAAGIFGYSLARRALAPIERMAEHAQSITADRLHDRLPIGNPKNELGRLASVFNDTLSRLEESFEQMRRFTADVSHELRTPLTAIRSVGEVGLRERRDEKAYRGIIGSMLEEVDRLASLIDRLLRWSRAETGQTRLAQEVIDLRQLAEDVAGHLGVLAEEKQQLLTVEQSGSPRGIGDRQVLRQALIDLVDNAIKYTPAGGRIRVRVSEMPTGVTIDVIDEGPGIPPDLRSQIFSRYERGGHGAFGPIGGTGLGLSISRWAVEANGGTLTLEPDQGSGSTFRITLPRAGKGVRSPVDRARPTNAA